VAEDPALPAEFGADAEEYPTLLHVMMESYEGELPFSNQALNQCLSRIQAIDCESLPMEAIEIREDGIPGLDRMIPDEDCPEIF
jgi:hypothetical protein